MTLIDLFKKNKFQNSLVIGYFGGTNYGDELLLEILQGLLYKNSKVNVNYKNKNKEEVNNQLSFGRSVFIRSWKKFLKHPIQGLEFIIYFFKYRISATRYILAKHHK